MNFFKFFLVFLFVFLSIHLCLAQFNLRGCSVIDCECVTILNVSGNVLQIQNFQNATVYNPNISVKKMKKLKMF